MKAFNTQQFASWGNKSNTVVPAAPMHGHGVAITYKKLRNNELVTMYWNEWQGEGMFVTFPTTISFFNGLPEAAKNEYLTYCLMTAYDYLMVEGTITDADVPVLQIVEL